MDARWQWQQVDTEVAEHEDRDVRHEDHEDDHERCDRRQPADQQRRSRTEQRERDDRLDRERRAPRPHRPRDDRTHSDHRGEVERVRAEHDAEADIAFAAEDRRDRGRELRTVGGDRRQDPEQRLGEAEPDTDTVEPIGEHRGRDQRHA